MAAGTLVVRERTPGARRLPIPVHPAAAAWAAGVELSGLGDDLALSIRQYLGRLGQLDPGAAASLGERLTAETATRIGMWPPPGMHPAVYLSAVLAERQRRDWERRAGASAPVVSFVPPSGPSAPIPPSTPAGGGDANGGWGGGWGGGFTPPS